MTGEEDSGRAFSQSPKHELSDNVASPPPKQLRHRQSPFQSWPQGHAIDVSYLARNGFVYQGVVDEVECSHCKFRIRDITDKEDLKQRHFEENPDCFFVRVTNDDQSSRSTNGDLKRPVSDDDEDGGRPRKYPALSGTNGNNGASMIGSQIHAVGGSGTSSHLGTSNPVLANSPKPILSSNNRRIADSTLSTSGSMAPEKNIEQKLYRLPKSDVAHHVAFDPSGLYCIGPDDRLQCWSCKNTLGYWRVEQAPLNEHTKEYFAKCPCTASRSNEEQPGSSSSRTDEATAILDHPVVSQVLQMGFSTKIIIDVVQRHIEAYATCDGSLIDRLGRN